MEDLISVIVPIYNASACIEKTVQSILEQTYKNIEIILIDDGSSDKSYSIIQELSKKDNRIQVYHKNNGGVSSARNLGISKANGKYTYFMDSDDLVDKKLLEVLHENIVKYCVEMSICNYNIQKENKSYAKNEASMFIGSKEQFLKNIAIYEGYLWNKLFITKYVKLIKFDESIYICEDQLFIIDYLKYCSTFYYDNRALYNYYLSNNSAINKKRWNERKLTIIIAYEKMLERLTEYDFNVYKNLYISYFTYCNEIYHIDRKYVSKEKVNNIYLNILRTKEYSIKNKANVYIKYRFYYLYAFIRNIFYHIK